MEYQITPKKNIRLDELANYAPEIIGKFLFAHIKDSLAMQDKKISHDNEEFLKNLSAHYKNLDSFLKCIKNSGIKASRDITDSLKELVNNLRDRKHLGDITDTFSKSILLIKGLSDIKNLRQYIEESFPKYKQMKELLANEFNNKLSDDRELHSIYKKLKNYKPFANIDVAGKNLIGNNYSSLLEYYSKQMDNYNGLAKEFWSRTSVLRNTGSHRELISLGNDIHSKQERVDQLLPKKSSMVNSLNSHLLALALHSPTKEEEEALRKDSERVNSLYKAIDFPNSCSQKMLDDSDKQGKHAESAEHISYTDL